ncbi:MAG TPA: hypothetical protein V6C65_38940 [Allocoleopsis sp.]
MYQRVPEQMKFVGCSDIRALKPELRTMVLSYLNTRTTSRSRSRLPRNKIQSQDHRYRKFLAVLLTASVTEGCYTSFLWSKAEFEELLWGFNQNKHNLKVKDDDEVSRYDLPNTIDGKTFASFRHWLIEKEYIKEIGRPLQREKDGFDCMGAYSWCDPVIVSLLLQYVDEPFRIEYTQKCEKEALKAYCFMSNAAAATVAKTKMAAENINTNEWFNHDFAVKYFVEKNGQKTERYITGSRLLELDSDLFNLIANKCIPEVKSFAAGFLFILNGKSKLDHHDRLQLPSPTVELDLESKAKLDMLGLEVTVSFLIKPETIKRYINERMDQLNANRKFCKVDDVFAKIHSIWSTKFNSESITGEMWRGPLSNKVKSFNQKQEARV